MCPFLDPAVPGGEASASFPFQEVTVLWLHPGETQPAGAP